mgnify:CR=1 FL=1
MHSILFEPIRVGNENLSNRVVMAPMTRSRSSQPGDVPNDIMATYYGQRAEAGLIVTEGAPISPVARGYSLTPGIYSQAHIDGWKKTTEAVHKNGGKIFIQLWHVGRRSHEIIAGEQPVSSSSVKIPDKVYGPDDSNEHGFGMIETSTPRAMTIEDIDSTITDFVQAAKNAIEAGFDGVELHGAHGYLIEQFLRKSSNKRKDCYGGSEENRCRFLLEVTKAVVRAIGHDKVAIRLSPFIIDNDNDAEHDLMDLSLKLLGQLAPLKLAYLHFSENIGNSRIVTDSYRQQMRSAYSGKIMVAGKYTQSSAQEVVSKGYADLVAFGQPFITNPDLVNRMKYDHALSPIDSDAQSTFYGGNEKGYTDYPTVSQQS